MKQLVKLNKRPLCGGQKFTYVLRYIGEDGKRKWETLGHADRRKAEKQRAQKENTKDTWEWFIKDAEHRTLPLTDEIIQMLVDHHPMQEVIMLQRVMIKAPVAQ